MRYARWLRTQVEFPVRVPVYLLPGEFVRSSKGELWSASIFLPWDRSEEPYIKIATGDYPKLKRLWGRDNALAAYLHSLSHEVVHYRQWVETGGFSERGVVVRAGKMVERYSQTVNEP